MPSYPPRFSSLGAGPAAPAAAAPDRVKSYLESLRGLSPADLQAVTVTLQANLSNTTPVTNDYKVPAGRDLFVYQIHGYLRFTALNTEPASILGYLNLTPSERWIIKAMNCLVRLENKDRQHLFIDNNDIALGGIMSPMGFPIVYPPDAPLVVPTSQILRGTFQLQDSTTAVVGNATIYGVALTGVLVPREPGRPS